ncbi:hypothetical protein C8R43DRAFT_1103412 [Mycena crocata]|nr:hypothetical protein C8R43DRAFT_1103412 [Mycena crocata]
MEWFRMQVNLRLPEGYKAKKVKLEDGGPNIDPATLPQKTFMVTSLPNLPFSLPAEPYADGRPAPGKGLAAFSTVALHTGDLILSERALLIAPTHLFATSNLPSHYSQEQVMHIVLAEAEQYLEAVFIHMEPEDKIAYMALANSYLQDGSGPIVGVMRTNSVGAEPLTRPEFFAPQPQLLPEHGFKVRHGVVLVSSLCGARHRPRRSDTDPTAPAAVRQKILEPYGFRCDCRACCEPYRSDMRRKTIRDAAVSPALMTVWNEEGLQVSPLYPQKVEALLEDCISCGDADNALVYGQMLGKMHWLQADVRRWMTMASIKSHPMWSRGVIFLKQNMFQVSPLSRRAWSENKQEK